MSRVRRAGSSFVLGLCLVGATQVALGQPSGARPAPGAPASPPKEPTAAAREEARTRFTRALELAEDGSLDAALEELKRAYALAPSYRILYNIGLVYQSLQDYARALDAFEQYLDEGGAEVPADRITDVNSRVERLKARIGYLDIRGNEPGLSIAVDDLPVGETPLPKKLRVRSGRRKVTATVRGRQPSTQIVELAGSETRVVTFDLHLAAPVVLKEPPRSPVPWISWGITAAFAGAAVTTGILTLNAAGDYDSTQRVYNQDAAAVRQSLNDAQSRTRAFGIATDVLGAVTLLGVGVSIYFTIRPPRVGSSSANQVGFYTTGKSLGLRYPF